MMQTLHCSAECCEYNEKECCCKESVQVSGRGAHESDDTCCQSFRESAR